MLILLIERSALLKLPRLPAELSSELTFDMVESVLIVLALLTVVSMLSTVVSCKP
jgi:hypothetical protein